MKFATERLARLRALPASERTWLGAGWMLLLLARPLLAFLPLSALCPRPRPAVTGRRLPVERVAWLVSVAARHVPWRTTCLERAMALAWILHGYGVPAVLRLGVTRREGTLVAHAWVEHEGRLLLAAPDDRGYAALERGLTAPTVA